MNRSVFKVAAQSLLVSALFIQGGCHRNHEHAAQTGEALPTAAVRVLKVETRPIVVTEEVVGTVQAKNRATLEAKESGRIEKLPLRLGDKVRAGDLIAELDSGEALARLEQAEAGREQAEREWKRIAALFEANSATRAERDAAEARLRVAKGAEAQAKALLGHARIIAPFNGVVTRKWADAGDLATPGKPIVEIEDSTTLQIEIDVPEALAARVDANTEVLAIDQRGKTIGCLVTELAPGVDPLTRTRKAKLEPKQRSDLASGQFVRVSLPMAERKAMVLPKDSVVERGQLEMVFTVETQRARMHLVKTRKHTEAQAEILSGLNPGDMVVVEGAERLQDGQPLEVK